MVIEYINKTIPNFKLGVIVPEVNAIIGSQAEIICSGNYNQQFCVFTSVVKIPEILCPVLTPKFGDFQGFFPKYPQSLRAPCPQSIPKHFWSCNPIPIPRIGGFLGINSNKSPKFELSLSKNYHQVFNPIPTELLNLR